MWCNDVHGSFNKVEIQQQQEPNRSRRRQTVEKLIPVCRSDERLKRDPPALNHAHWSEYSLEYLVVRSAFSKRTVLRFPR